MADVEKLRMHLAGIKHENTEIRAELDFANATKTDYNQALLDLASTRVILDAVLNSSTLCSQLTHAIVEHQDRIEGLTSDRVTESEIVASIDQENLEILSANTTLAEQLKISDSNANALHTRHTKLVKKLETVRSRAFAADKDLQGHKQRVKKMTEKSGEQLSCAMREFNEMSEVRTRSQNSIKSIQQVLFEELASVRDLVHRQLDIVHAQKRVRSN